MGRTKVDSTYFSEKVFIRISALPDKKDITILDCFAGTGKLWNEVKRQTDKNISIIQIDEKETQNIDLVGDNVKYLKSLDLSKFDIIDLDAYGTPFAQLEIIFNKKYKGIVIVTVILKIMGGLHHKMLNELGYTNKMIKKCKSLFYKNGIEKVKKYLFNKGVTGIKGYFITTEHNYFYFNLT